MFRNKFSITKISKMSKLINLGPVVMISDPCYEKGDIKFSNVVPGTYESTVRRAFGRISTIEAIHTDKTGRWETNGLCVSVDSGQAGIFSAQTYRNDSIAEELPWLSNNGNPFGDSYNISDNGDLWYVKMCDRTLSKDRWGTYPSGAVASSGFGDGGYPLEICKTDDDQICGFRIIFIDDSEIDRFSYLND